MRVCVHVRPGASIGLGGGEVLAGADGRVANDGGEFLEVGTHQLESLT